MLAFVLMWASQVVSLLGSDIAKFGLRVWTYNKTGSVTEFAALTFLTEVPALLVSPFAGLVVDKFSHKRIIIATDTITALSTLWIAFMVFTEQLESWHIFVANVIAALMGAFQWPAFQASVVLLVPEDRLAKVEGMNQMAPALSMLIAPALGGAALYAVGFEGVVAIELLTFLLSLAVMLFARIPAPKESEEGRRAKGSLWSEIIAGWKYVRSKPGLAGLFYFLGQSHFCSGIVQVLVTPLVLSFSTPGMLGSVLSVSGTGAMFGAAGLGLWGVPRRAAYGFLGIGMLQGLLLAGVGVVPDAYFVLGVAFLYMFFIPTVRASRDAVLRRQVPQDLQGRVFALGQMISKAALPLAASLAGPLADLYFEPWLASPEAPLGSTAVGSLWGTGKGRGVAFLFFVVGCANAAFCALGLLYAPLRRVDEPFEGKAKRT